MVPHDVDNPIEVAYAAVAGSPLAFADPVAAWEARQAATAAELAGVATAAVALMDFSASVSEVGDEVSDLAGGLGVQKPQLTTWEGFFGDSEEFPRSMRAWTFGHFDPVLNADGSVRRGRRYGRQWSQRL